MSSKNEVNLVKYKVFIQLRRLRKIYDLVVNFWLTSWRLLSLKNLKPTLSGEDEVDDGRKFFFSLEPLILELLSCFLFLGFFEVLESSSERLLLISRLEEEPGSLSSKRGMISNPAAAADDDPP